MKNILKVDAQFGGEDQRKIFTFAEKVCQCFFNSLFEVVFFRIFLVLDTRSASTS